MSDDTAKTKQDRNFIAVGEDYEVAYWTATLGVTKEELAAAVGAVGNSAEAVRKYLKK